DELRRLGIARERRLQDRDRLVIASQARKGLGEHRRRGHLPWLILQNRLEQRDRFGVALAVHRQPGELKPRCDVALVHLERATILGLGLLWLAVQEVGVAEEYPRVNVLLVGSEHLLEEGDRL